MPTRSPRGSNRPRCSQHRDECLLRAKVRQHDSNGARELPDFIVRVHVHDRRIVAVGSATGRLGDGQHGPGDGPRGQKREHERDGQPEESRHHDPSAQRDKRRHLGLAGPQRDETAKHIAAGRAQRRPASDVVLAPELDLRVRLDASRRVACWNR